MGLPIVDRDADSFLTGFDLCALPEGLNSSFHAASKANRTDDGHEDSDDEDRKEMEVDSGGKSGMARKDMPFNALMAQQSSKGDVYMQRLWLRKDTSAYTCTRSPSENVPKKWNNMNSKFHSYHNDEKVLSDNWQSVSGVSEITPIQLG